jgi:hypothetical protein
LIVLQLTCIQGGENLEFLKGREIKAPAILEKEE